jgi:hypothetical protein
VLRGFIFLECYSDFASVLAELPPGLTSTKHAAFAKPLAATQSWLTSHLVQGSSEMLLDRKSSEHKLSSSQD